MTAPPLWEEVVLADLGTIVTGRTPPSTNQSHFGSFCPFITPTDMKGQKNVTETERFLSEEGYALLNRCVVPARSVAVSCIGWQMGKAVVTTRPSVTNQQLNTVIPNQRVDPDFLYYHLCTRREELRRLGSVGTRTPIINKSVFASLKLRLPPTPVQLRIAGILSAYDDLIENNQRRIQVLEDMARTLYREWFVEFRFPGHGHTRRVASPLGEIPEGWEAAPLSSLVDFAKGRKPAETRQEPHAGDVKVLLIDSLRGGEAVFASSAKLVLAETRDTIMVMDGASSCEVTVGSSGAVGSTLGRFRTTRPGRFSPHALHRFLEAKAEEFKSKNIGAAIPHANKDYILTQPVALPPEGIAASFHAQLEPLQGTIETLKSQIHNLHRTRDLLLPRLLSGQAALDETAA